MKLSIANANVLLDLEDRYESHATCPKPSKKHTLIPHSDRCKGDDDFCYCAVELDEDKDKEEKDGASDAESDSAKRKRGEDTTEDSAAKRRKQD